MTEAAQDADAEIDRSAFAEVATADAQEADAEPDAVTLADAATDAAQDMLALTSINALTTTPSSARGAEANGEKPSMCYSDQTAIEPAISSCVITQA